MEKVLEIRIGEGRVHSGLLPVDAVRLVEDLIAAVVEQGGDAETWRLSNPHIKILGKGSTRAALYTEFARRLRPQVAAFNRAARSLNLGPKGREFVHRHISESSPWGYVEVKASGPATPKARLIRFDPQYRQRFDTAYRAEEVSGRDEIYARVVRAGGDKPTVKLELLDGTLDTYDVVDAGLAKEIAKHLYETVKLRAFVYWNRETLKIKRMTITGIDEVWSDAHLGDVLQRSGGKLDIEVEFEAVEELIRSRRED